MRPCFLIDYGAEWRRI